MLQIVVPERELYDEENEQFITLKREVFQIEHSLVSLSKWESKWKVPFIGTKEKTTEQIIDYIRCMTITQNVNPIIYDYLPSSVLKEISDYIIESKTATWFSERNESKGKGEVITAELIYYWMIAQNIPIECQKWHLSRLLTLIRVCNIKNSPPKKMSKKDMLAERRALNASRRGQINSKG